MSIGDLIARVSAWLRQLSGGTSHPDPAEPPVGSTVAIGDQVWHHRTAPHWRNCELGVPQNPVDKTWAELKVMGTVEVIHIASH